MYNFQVSSVTCDMSHISFFLLLIPKLQQFIRFQFRKCNQIISFLNLNHYNLKLGLLSLKFKCNHYSFWP